MTDSIDPSPSMTTFPHPVEESNLINIEQFAAVSLRVGQIVSAEALPKSKKMLKLRVNLGEESGSRQVLAGIAKFYTAEQLLGKKVVVVANLKPATLMGELSEGMLLAAASDDNAILALVDPGNDMPIGATVR